MCTPSWCPILGHERGYSASVIGSILGAFAIAAAVIRVFLPMLAAHLREWVVVSMAMAITALLFAVYPLMPSALTMGLCSVLLGLTLGSVQPMIMSTLHQITPAHRQGEALALRLMSINASSVVMPLLFGTRRRVDRGERRVLDRRRGRGCGGAPGVAAAAESREIRRLRRSRATPRCPRVPTAAPRR